MLNTGQTISFAAMFLLPNMYLCRRATKIQLAGNLSWSLISGDQRGQEIRCDRCMSQSDVMNPPNPYIRPPATVGFKNTKHSEVQIQVDTDPQVIKVVLIEGRERDK